MAKLMKENDNRQHKQEGNDVADKVATECAEAPQNVHNHHNPRPRRYGARIVSESLLG